MQLSNLSHLLTEYRGSSLSYASHLKTYKECRKKNYNNSYFKHFTHSKTCVVIYFHKNINKLRWDNVGTCDKWDNLHNTRVWKSTHPVYVNKTRGFAYQNRTHSNMTPETTRRVVRFVDHPWFKYRGQVLPTDPFTLHIFMIYFDPYLLALKIHCHSAGGHHDQYLYVTVGVYVLISRVSAQGF